MRTVRALTDGFPIFVTRGVEFRPGPTNAESDEAFSASIRRGVHQLQFAHVPRLTDTMRSVGSHRGSVAMGCPDTEVHVSTLILVTTAELWAFRPEIDLSSIERAGELTEIAEQVPAVEFESVLSRELRVHQQEWLTAIKKGYADHSEDPPEVKEARKHIRETAGQALRLASPSVFIVSHHYLEEFLTRQAKASRSAFEI